MSLFEKVSTLGCLGGSLLLLGVTAHASDYGKEAKAGSGVAEVTSETRVVDVYKSPTCGCCAEWITHAQTHGLISKVHHPSSLAEKKSALGIGTQYRSCHTAVDKQGYVFEGHVPAKLVTQFLANPPEGAIGLSVPGMPAGSPGMEMANTFTPYPVLLLMKDGSAVVYAKIDQQSEQY